MVNTVPVSNVWTGRGLKKSETQPVAIGPSHVVRDREARSEIDSKCGNRPVVEALFEKIAARTPPRRRYEAHEQFIGRMEGKLEF
jgi:hypothetical protein